MQFIYTLHAQEKLKRSDIFKFKITKKLIESILLNPLMKSKTKILVMNFSQKPVDDSFEVENAILEVDKDNKPVSLEILHASKFFNIASKELPKDIKQKFFATQ